MGCIFKRKWKNKKTGKLVEGATWWIKYYRNGKSYRESSCSEKISVAQRLLKKREGEISEGKLPGIYFDKVTFDELAEDYLKDYRINNRDTIAKAARSVRYLKEEFGGARATDVTTDRIKSYIEKRMEKGLSNASINRELAALKRIFHLAAECTPPRVSMIPYIPMLKESNIRKGFFEVDEYKALKQYLPVELRPIVTFAYHSGWRKSEILNLTWDRVDLNEEVVRLDPGETKNDQGRILYLNEELMEEMRVLLSGRHLGCPYVFHRNGIPIKDFRGSWSSACIKAGLFEVVKDDIGNVVTDSKGRPVKNPTKIFHDFRRTAIRDMVRSGVSERVAMRISGHKTRNVFDRYNIVSDQDLREAAQKKQAYFEKQDATVKPIDQKWGKVIRQKQATNE